MKKVVLLGTALALVSSAILAGCSNSTEENTPKGRTVTLNPSATATFYDSPVEGYETPSKAVNAWVADIQAKKYEDACKYITATGTTQLRETFKARSCVDNLALYAKKFYTNPVKVVQVRINSQVAMKQNSVELSLTPNSDAYVAVDSTKAVVSILPVLHYEEKIGWQYSGYNVI